MPKACCKTSDSFLFLSQVLTSVLMIYTTVIQMLFVPTWRVAICAHAKMVTVELESHVQTFEVFPREF